MIEFCTSKVRIASAAGMLSAQRIVMSRPFGERTCQYLCVSLALLLGAGCSPETDRSSESPRTSASNPVVDDAVPAETGYVEQRAFLTLEVDYYRPDAQVGHVHVPHAVRKFEWREHPRGEIVFRTNNLGFREDVDTEQEAREDIERILVTGDSHIDGVVWNHESYPNVLEDLLQETQPTRPIEVLNGGAGYFGPYQYRRLLEKHAGLGLSSVIVTVYTGNDFLDAGLVIESTGQPNERPPDYWPTFNALPNRLRRVFGQHLNQVFYLNTFPQMQKACLDFTVAELASMSAHAADLHASMLVVLLPSKLDVEQNPRDLAGAGAALNLSAEQLNINRRMAELLKARLEELGIAHLDLLPAMQGRPGLYWERDHHLSLDGHRFVAERLALPETRQAFRSDSQ